MQILGIDPGSRLTGWGVIELQGRSIKYLNSGIIDVRKFTDFTHRVGRIALELTQVLKAYQIQEAALESLIHVKNVSSLSKLAQARGAIVASLYAKGIYQMREYSPNAIKVSVSNYGHSDKEAIQKSLDFMFQSKIAYKSSDESDALAVAICHALNRGRCYSSSTNSKRGQSLKSAFKHLDKR